MAATKATPEQKLAVKIGELYCYTNYKGYHHYIRPTRITDYSVFVKSVVDGEDLDERREGWVNFLKYKLVTQLA